MSEAQGNNPASEAAAAGNPASEATAAGNPAILFAGGRPQNPASAAKAFAPAFAGLDKPTVAYIGAASDDSQSFYLMMKANLLASGAHKVTKVRLASKKADAAKARQQLTEADVVFFSGGEVEDGMVWLAEHGLVGLLRELVSAGKRFVGVSAGTIMLGSHWVHWDVEGDDDTSSLFDCLGVSPLLFDVHGESEDWVELKCALRLLGDGAIGYALPSGCAVSADSQGNLAALAGEPIIYTNRGGSIVVSESRA